MAKFLTVDETTGQIGRAEGSAGGVVAVTTVSTNSYYLTTEHYVAQTSASAILYLPSATSGMVGKEFLIRPYRSGSNTSLRPVGTDKIDGSTNVTILNSAATTRVVCVSVGLWSL